MKRLILIFTVAVIVSPHAQGADFRDFFKFYSAFNPESERVILMPSALRVELYPGEREKITLLSRPGGIEVSWQSGAPDICRIEECGKDFCTVSGKSPGEGVIYLRDASGKSEKEIHVTVLKRKPSISLEPEEITLARGESAVVRAKVSEQDGAQISWSVNPSRAAAISYGGNVCRVKALRAGEFEVAAKLESGPSASTRVRVEGSVGADWYRICVTALLIGAFACMAYAWWLRRGGV